MSEPVHVCVTGAAGQIAYSLIFEICRGSVFGESRDVVLSMLDIPPMLERLQGVVMELEDCAFPLLKGVVATADPAEAFRGAAYCLLVGAMPRRDGMERSDLLKANAGIFAAQGKAIAANARDDVRVLVVGNPANTNALLTLHSSGLPRDRISALTRLDQNRATAQIAAKVGVHVRQVRNVVIWGNHSSTQVPDVSHGVVTDFPKAGDVTPIAAAVSDDVWLQNDFIRCVQTRGAAVIKARGLSSAASAAKAICDHVRDWALGTDGKTLTSMAVVTDGTHYGIPEGLVYSMPVRCRGEGVVEVVDGLAVSPFYRALMDHTCQELVEERSAALPFLAGE